MKNIPLDTIESAIEAIRLGEMIIVVDDEDRENEGDFLAAASCVTPEMINFMATHGRGLICAPLTEERCEQLGLDLMVNTNTTPHETPFTVSIDLVGHGVTTGISASDRALTIQALTWPQAQSADFSRPGHIFPLKAKKRRCAAQSRAYRSSHRFCAPCRITPGWRDLRDHEPRRKYGAPPGAAPGS